MSLADVRGMFSEEIQGALQADYGLRRGAGREQIRMRPSLENCHLAFQGCKLAKRQ
jgi:hypothetical protein